MYVKTLEMFKNMKKYLPHSFTNVKATLCMILHEIPCAVCYMAEFDLYLIFKY